MIDKVHERACALDITFSGDERNTFIREDTNVNVYTGTKLENKHISYSCFQILRTRLCILDGLQRKFVDDVLFTQLFLLI